MIRRLARPVLTACAVLALSTLVAQPALAARPSALLLSASCGGTIHTSITTTGVTTTGSATCLNATTLNLTTTANAAGVVSSVTSLLPALPTLPVPINTLVPAVGVTSACSVLVDAGTGAKVTSACTTST
jgi:hypothetical protein